MRTDAERLDAVLEKTQTIIAGVEPTAHTRPTPCAEMDVGALVDHLVGWTRVFAAQVAGREPDVDVTEFRASPAAAAEFGEAAAGISRALAAAAAGGEPAPGPPPPMMLCEFIVHGWDLAVATDQPVSFGEDEAKAALAFGQHMMKPEYRGAGKAFGDEVQAPADADAVQRLVAFYGRDPAWRRLS